MPLRSLPGDEPAAAALDAMDQAVAVLPQPRPVLALGLRWLERHLPAPPARRSILHTDVRNGNLIVGDDGLRAVLDWEGALASGDPMQDLAWPALRMWRFRQDEAEVGGFAGRSALAAGYEDAGGEFDVERFRWWKVEGTLRWAVGLASQAMAYLDGRVPNIVMAASGRRVSELEWDLLMLIRPSADQQRSGIGIRSPGEEPEAERGGTGGSGRGWRSSPPSAPSWRLGYLLAVKLDDPLLLNDSLYYSMQAGRNSDGDWFREALFELPGAEHGPLTPLWLTPWGLLPGDIIGWQRFAMTVLGIATVAVIGLVGRRLAGPSPGSWRRRSRPSTRTCGSTTPW